MPELRFTDKNHKRILAIELALVKATRATYRDFRLALLEVLDNFGINNPGLRAQLINEFAQLRGQLTQDARQAAPKVIDGVTNYATDILRLSNQLGLTNLGPNELFGVMGPEINRAISGQITQAPELWVDSLQLGVLNEVARLQAAGESQEAATNRLVGTRAQDGRASAWAKGAVSLAIGAGLAVWAANNRGIAQFSASAQEVTGIEYQKQAIATIDEVTTDCCLRVHGQVQPLDKPFKLVGSPRFADEVMRPPFHWNCRSSQALYHASFERVGLPTSSLVDAARAELLARADTGQRVEIHPSSATSGR